MSTTDTLFDLSRLVVEALVDLWPVAIALVMVGVMGAATEGARKTMATIGWSKQVAPLMIPIAMLAIATLWSCDSSECRIGSPTRDAAYAVAEYSLLVLVVAHAALAARLVWRARGARLATLAVQLAVLWLSLLVGFVGTMSVTNDWL